MLQPLRDRISFFPLRYDLKGYSKAYFFSDITAALAVALFSAPQAMADSLVAGLPPAMGLSTIIIGTCVVAIFGSSNFLSAGPTNSIAILIGTVLTELMEKQLLSNPGLQPETMSLLMINWAVQITILTGLLQLLAAFFQFGQLIRFIGRPVVIGYLVGVVLNVFASQLVNFFGISSPTEVLPFYARVWYFITHAHLLHTPTMLLGIICLLATLFINHVIKKPRHAAISTLVLSGTLVYLLEYFSPIISTWLNVPDSFLKVATIGDFGGTDNLLPHFQLPTVSFTLLTTTLFPVACTIALFSVLEASSLSRFIAAKTGDDMSINQEIFGLGMGNLAAGFFGGMAISGSTSRTMLNYAVGGKTRLAIIMSSFFVVSIVLAFGPFVAYIPLTALATILFFTIVRMIHLPELRRCLAVTRSDAAVLITTVVACIFLSLNVAFYFGFVVSVALYLRQAARPKLIIYGILGAIEPRYIPSILNDSQQYPIYILQVEGELFFAAADTLQSTLRHIAERLSVKVIILNVQNARDIDLTSCQALERVIDLLYSSNRYLLLCGVRSYFYEVLSNYGLVETIGQKHLFRLNKLAPTQSLQDAIQCAHALAHDQSPENDTPLETL